MTITKYKGNFVHLLINGKTGENVKHNVGDVFCTEEWYGRATWIVESIEETEDDEGRTLNIIHAVWKDVRENPERKIFYCETDNKK